MLRGSLFLALSLVLASVGCESRVSIGARCDTDMQCGELRCRYGRCRAECTSASDCAETGAFCIGTAGAGVCTVPALDRCSLDCGDGLECVGEQCLLPCEGSCLPGSSCLDSHCVSDEVDAGTPDAAAPDASMLDASVGPRDGGLGVGPTRHSICNGYEHVCAIGSGGRVYCWGNNHVFQLGDGDLDGHGPICPIVAPADDCATPGMLPVLREGTEAIVEDVVSLGCGEAHTCALTRAGEVLCWGYSDFVLGTDAAGFHYEAVSPIASGATELSVSWAHACALVDGAIRCWGHNGPVGGGIDGRLGVTDVETIGTPTRIAESLSGLTLLAAGSTFTCGVSATGTVTCAGATEWGVATPMGRVVEGVTNPRALVAGNVHACALADEGLLCWGSGTSLGAGGASLPDCSGSCRMAAAPVVGSAGLTVRALSTGPGEHTCVVTEPDGEVRCWGYQPFGECGVDPSTAMSVSTVGPPVTIEGGGTLRDVVEVTTGASTCARTAAGDVYCWGFNSYGQLGMFETVPVGPPTILSQPYPHAHLVPVP